MELFIPARINKDDKFGKGFGKAEMRRTAIFVVFGLGTGLCFGLLFFYTAIQTILLATVAGGAFTGVVGYFFSVKNSINLSVAHYIAMVKRFYNEQRFFLYKKLKEW